jgi:hypothetical protein
MPDVKIELRAGDVLSYLPSQHHCRQGTALVTEDGLAFDTFWGIRPDNQSHFLTPKELTTAEVKFNVNDFDMLDRYSRSSVSTWETYHADDRGRIGSQHQHQSVYFVRKGAQPDLGTQIENARGEVEEAESALRSAQYRLERRREGLARLEAAALTFEDGMSLAEMQRSVADRAGVTTDYVAALKPKEKS